MSSHKYFTPEHFVYVVREEEGHLYSMYKKLGLELKVIPDGAVSNIADTRNWILDNKDSEYVVMVDDDYSGIYWTRTRTDRREQISLSVEQIDKIICIGFQLAQDAKCGMWGMNVNFDPMMYRIVMPFSFAMPCLGPFQAFLDTSLRYDESMPLKEDYDMFLQQYFKHGGVLRLNFLCYLVDHQKMKGGCQTYRTLEAEKQQNILLEKKWGSKIIRRQHGGYTNVDSINRRIYL